MNQPTRSQVLTVTLLTAAGTWALAGCSKGPETVSYDSIRGNLSPGMRGVTDTVDEAKGWSAYMTDMEARMTVDDFKRALYLDHASRLDPRPTIDISGNPR